MQQLLCCSFQHHLGICLTRLTTSWNVSWSWPRYKPRTLTTHLIAAFSHTYFERRVICPMVTELFERTSTMWVHNRSAFKWTQSDATYLNHLHDGIHDRRNILCLHVIQVAAHVQLLDGFIFANCIHYRCQICIHVCNKQTFVWTLNLLLYMSRQPHPKSEVTVRVLKKMWCLNMCTSQNTGAMHSWQTLNQGCTNLRCHVARPTKFCTVAPNVCGSAECDVLHVALLVSRILRWLLDFSKVCALLY